MIGDSILLLIRVWKQCFCLHDYKTVFPKSYCMPSYRECKKCGRIK